MIKKINEIDKNKLIYIDMFLDNWKKHIDNLPEYDNKKSLEFRYKRPILENYYKQFLYIKDVITGFNGETKPEKIIKNCIDYINHPAKENIDDYDSWLLHELQVLLYDLENIK